MNFFLIINDNKILDIIDLYKYVIIINITFRVNNKLIIFAFIIKIEISQIFNFLYFDKFIALRIISLLFYNIFYMLILNYLLYNCE